jgi:hypothetical protein
MNKPNRPNPSPGTPDARRTAATALAGFALAFALAAPPTLGDRTAHAERPTLPPSDAAAALDRFEPMVPSADPQPSTRSLPGGIQAEARLDRTGDRPAVVVRLENPSASARTAHCTVALESITFPDSPPWARLVPPPTVERLFSHDLAFGLAAGERRELRIPLPSGLLEDGDSGTGAGETGLRIAIEAPDA